MSAGGGNVWISSAGFSGRMSELALAAAMFGYPLLVF
jgi:hypothetical protein